MDETNKIKSKAVVLIRIRDFEQRAQLITVDVIRLKVNPINHKPEMEQIGYDYYVMDGNEEEIQHEIYKMVENIKKDPITKTLASLIRRSDTDIFQSGVTTRIEIEE